MENLHGLTMETHFAVAPLPPQLPPSDVYSSFEKWIIVFTIVCHRIAQSRTHFAECVHRFYIFENNNYNVKVIAHGAGVDRAPPPPSAPQSTMENVSYN